MSAHCCCVGCNRRQQKGCNRRQQKGCESNELLPSTENWLTADHTTICSKYLIKGGPSRDLGDPDFVPTMFSYTPVGKNNDYLLQAKELFNRQKTIADEVLLSLNTFEESNVSGTSTETDRSMCDTSTQTDIDVSILQEILATNRQIKVQIDTLQKEKDFLLNDLAANLNERNDVQCKKCGTYEEIKRCR
ncbi:hypothetical protein ACJMK2_005453 [Sinanodonta woodiana]|uniref:THAP-type domain-containing protein n=1 Tax=Sinanodonta woodiana TaxID=1069815 RepID=A0ABD3VQ33_SINWO